MSLLLDLFTTRAASLLHPLVMAFAILLFLYTSILGFRVRHKRVHPRPSSLGLLSGRALDRRHHKLSAGLVCLTTAACFLGMGNTYARSGRLFPGPHLWGGLSVLLALSVNVMLAPWMAAVPVRGAHAVVGAVILALLANQLISGIPILLAVWRTV